MNKITRVLDFAVKGFKDKLDASQSRVVRPARDDSGIERRGTMFDSQIRPTPMIELETGDPIPADQEPPNECPSVEIVCDSIEASLSKCGFEEFNTVSDPPKFYLKKTTGIDATIDIHNTDSTDVYTGTGTKTIVDTYSSPECDLTTECSGTATINNDPHYADPPCVETFDPCVYPDTTWGPVCGASFHAGPCTVINETTTEKVTSCPDDTPGGPGYTNNNTWEQTETLEDEYTTELLKSNTVDELPAYSGQFDCTPTPAFEEGQGCSCVASRLLSDDEISYSIQRFKYKFLFSPAANGFTISWKERFTPLVGGDPTDTSRSFSVGGSEPVVSESSVFTCLEPAENGTIEIIDIRCNGVAI